MSEQNNWQSWPAARAVAERGGEAADLAQLLTGELSQRQAAERCEVDPTTTVPIRKIGRAGTLAALAQSRPGRPAGGEDAELQAARAEIARLEEAVKEQ